MNVLQTNFNYAKPLYPLIIPNVQYIILHHLEAITATPEEIHQWHLDKGWAGFGYNEYIRKDGTVYIGRGDQIGAQCQDYNSKSYGIACEGNYMIEKEMPKAQYDSLIERLKYHKNRMPALIKIDGHKAFVNTSCPGDNFPLEKAINLEPLVPWIDWKTILQKVSISPEAWERSINAAVSAAKADGNLGDLEIFKYLPELIEKVYNTKGA